MADDGISFYLNQAGKIPLLTPAEEIELGRCVQAMMHLLNEKPEGPYTTAERRRLRAGKRARERMILANMRLVTKLAKKYLPRCRKLDMQDLLQEGIAGLVRGVEKFDPSLGYKFSTYAYWWIRQGITRAVSQTDRTIKLPYAASDCLVKARYFVERFRFENGRAPTVEEIAEECNVSPMIMGEYLKHASDASSLDVRTHSKDEDGSSILELIPSQGETPWDYAEKMEMFGNEGRAQEAISQLSPRDQKIIQLRFAITSEDGTDFFPLTQTEVAKELGISRQYVQNREVLAIMKLRKIFAA